MAVRTGTKALARAIAGIDGSTWERIDYPEGGEAEVAENVFGNPLTTSHRYLNDHSRWCAAEPQERFQPPSAVEVGGTDGFQTRSECTHKERRLVVCRTRLVGPQATLWPDWRHFAFLTDLTGKATEVDAFYRAHAVVELAIDDWKEGSGMEHCPTGSFTANGAWLCCAVLAHNLMRFSAALGDLIEEDESLVVAATLRTRYFAVPARLVNGSGRPTLHTLALGA